MARPELFDMAVNRAATYAGRLGALSSRPSAAGLHEVLEVWYLKTRFAYRIPLDDVIEALLRYPGPGAQWRGGRDGEWKVDAE